MRSQREFESPARPVAVEAANRHRVRRLRHASIALAMLIATTAATSAQVTGVVRDALTLAPIEEALVTQQATSTRVVTTSDGAYVLPLSAGTGITIVAAAKGYYNEPVVVASPATGIDIFLDAVPISDDPSYAFLTPEDCGTCHPNQLAEWTGSPMAAAGTNTWVYDLFDGTGTPGGSGGWVYLEDSVLASADPESDCSSCHQPETWIATPFSALADLSALPASATHGISCEVCHKIADVDVSRINFPGIFPGVVTFNRPTSPDQVQYGLLGDSTFELSGVMRPSYQPQLDAAVCGTCHQDKNDPDLDGDFEEPNGVISEPTYLEWEASPYGDIASPFYKSCVDCHMAPSAATQACVVLFPPLVREPGTIRNHRIEGTTPTFLENAVDLSVGAAQVGGNIEVSVSVANTQTGHHVPTGVTVRNLILLVEAWREQDGITLASTGTQTVHALGGVGDPAFGYYAGLPGKLFAFVNHDATGAGPVFFTDATGVLFDTRIPALATDTTQYSFAIPPDGGTLHVRARLLYRRAFRAIVDAKGWTQTGHGQPLEDVAAPLYGHLMEEQSTALVLPYTPAVFRRGDVSDDGQIQINDAIQLLSHLFQGGPASVCPDAADLNDSGALDIADAVYSLSYLFLPGSPAPAQPGPTSCGEDPGVDALGVCNSAVCP
ncbi:MAG: hypothetical protein ACKVX7_14975 [Planctomycetota bacterium]